MLVKPKSFTTSHASKRRSRNGLQTNALLRKSLYLIPTWVTHEADVDVSSQLHAATWERTANTTNHLQQQRLKQAADRGRQARRFCC